MRRALIAYALACALAALSPLIASGDRHVPVAFPGWPRHFDGHALTRLPDTAQEAAFYANQPVRHARFGAGQRIVLMSWADENITGFHLASVCFRAFGFALTEPVSQRGANGRVESCMDAERKGLVQRVCEHIRDGDGRVFQSETSWHMARLLGSTKPPYLGVSVVELAAAP